MSMHCKRLFRIFSGHCLNFAKVCWQLYRQPAVHHRTGPAASEGWCQDFLCVSIYLVLLRPLLHSLLYSGQMQSQKQTPQTHLTCWHADMLSFIGRSRISTGPSFIQSPQARLTDQDIMRRLHTTHGNALIDAHCSKTPSLVSGQCVPAASPVSWLMVADLIRALSLVICLAQDRCDRTRKFFVNYTIMGKVDKNLVFIV